MGRLARQRCQPSDTLRHRFLGEQRERAGFSGGSQVRPAAELDRCGFPRIVARIPDELIDLDPDRWLLPPVRARFAEVLTKVGRVRDAREHVLYCLRNAKTRMGLPRRWAIPADLTRLYEEALRRVK